VLAAKRAGLSPSMFRDVLIFFCNSKIKMKTENKNHAIAETAYDEKRRNHLYQLKQLVSTTQNDFKILYLDFIDMIETYLKNKPEIFLQALDRSIHTLKIRRAYMLPIGSDAETCYQQQDIWTYALYTAALLIDFISEEKNILEVSEKLLPLIGFAWLKENALVFTKWSYFLKNECAENNMLRNIIFYENNDLKKINTEISQENIISEIKKNEMLSNESPDTTKEGNEITDKSCEETNADPHPQTLSDTFVQWLKNEISHKRLSINQNDSLIHSVREGILLEIPQIYKEFLKSQGQTYSSTMKKKISDEISKDERFVRKENQHPVHIYFKGDWGARDQIEGLLIAPALLFKPEEFPEVNTQWLVDNCLA
jgi:hypothetical protein